MKKRWRFFILLGIVGLAVFSYFGFFYQKASLEKKHTQYSHGPYFVSVPIEKFSSANVPCLRVGIGKKRVTAILDLGFRGNFGFIPSVINEIEEKTYVTSRTMYNVRGNGYDKKVYQVPEMNIGRMYFSKPTVHEEPLAFGQDAAFVVGEGMPTSFEEGKIGWEIFYNVNLLVDVPNQKIAFCDGLESLKGQGYAVEAFVKIPMLLERGLVEFELMTPEGCLRCMLDTGSTWNILNRDLEEGETMEKAFGDPDNVQEYASLKIGRGDFGPISFHLAPIKIPIHIEAMLGMEFFEKHVVFLDFAKKQIYFLRDVSNLGDKS